MKRAILASLTLLAVVPVPPAGAYEMPYDPYPWCAVYSGDGGGGTNCGFLTLDQCRATVSGIGGACTHNQFYNPGRPAVRNAKRAPKASQ